jgi:hypothetical protein
MNILKKIILNVSNNNLVFKASYFEESKYLSCVTYKLRYVKDSVRCFHIGKFVQIITNTTFFPHSLPSSKTTACYINLIRQIILRYVLEPKLHRRIQFLFFSLCYSSALSTKVKILKQKVFVCGGGGLEALHYRKVYASV